MHSLKYRIILLATGTIALALAGCDLSALDGSAQIAAAKEAEGKAIGSACRHSGRALEECYAKNMKISKAAIFTGWREMDGYMRENNIEIIVPATAAAPAEPDAAKPDEEHAGEGKLKKSADAAPAPAETKKKAAEAPKEAPLKRPVAGTAGIKQVNHNI